MSVEIVKSDGQTVVKLSCNLDTTTSLEVEEVIAKLIEEHDPAEKLALVFDMSQVEFMSSAGLRVVMTTAKKVYKRNGSISIINTQNAVKHVFDMTGFTGTLDIV
jgi:anti-anti-sigma factor